MKLPSLMQTLFDDSCHTVITIGEETSSSPRSGPDSACLAAFTIDIRYVRRVEGATAGRDRCRHARRAAWNSIPTEIKPPPKPASKTPSKRSRP